MLFNRFGPDDGRFILEPGGHSIFPFLLWVLALVVLGAVAAWLLLSLRRGWAVPVGSAPAASAPAPVPAQKSDGAVEQARMRYARGEIARDEFMQIATDLGEPSEDGE